MSKSVHRRGNTRMSVISHTDLHTVYTILTCYLSVCVVCVTVLLLQSGNEQVYCSACKTHRDQTKRLAIFRFPSILVLHLKRFSSSASASASRYSYLLSSIGGT